MRLLSQLSDEEGQILTIENIFTSRIISIKCFTQICLKSFLLIKFNVFLTISLKWEQTYYQQQFYILFGTKKQSHISLSSYYLYCIYIFLNVHAILKIWLSEILLQKQEHLTFNILRYCKSYKCLKACILNTSVKIYGM